MLAINLIRAMQSLEEENAYLLLKNIKRMAKWRDILCSWIHGYNTVEVLSP